MFAKTAAALAALTFLVHFIFGGADALAPTLSAELSPVAAGAMHACWHIVSVFLLASVFVFYKGGQTAFHFALLWLSFAAVFVYVGFYQGGPEGLITNPQWTILCFTAILAFVHSQKEMSQRSSEFTG